MKNWWKFIVSIVNIVDRTNPIPIYITNWVRKTIKIEVWEISVRICSFLSTVFLHFEKWKMGKWSDNLDIKMNDSKLSVWQFERIWSITVAECGVHRVGFRTNWRNPYENNKSIYSVTFLIIPYFRASKFKSPISITGVVKFEKSSSKLVSRSKNWRNSSLDGKVGWVVHIRSINWPNNNFFVSYMQ